MTPDLWAGSPVVPRAWQATALPLVLDALRQRRSGLVVATMGSGKSRLQAQLARIALPKTVERGQRIVFIAPRKKLVKQLWRTVAEHCGPVNVGMFYGDKKQEHRPVIVCCSASLPLLRERLAALGARVALCIVDEAHNSESAVQLEELPALDPILRIGFTATPFRSAPKESLSLWDEVFYRYTMEDALRDRVLVPLRVIRWEGDEHEELDAACLEMMREHAQGPGIVSSRGIEDAEAYAAWLSGQGWASKAIHSKQGESEHGQLLHGLEHGAVLSLVHVALLAEGFDMPALRWLCARRKVGAAVRHYQEFGRVQRAHPGKTEALMFDPHLLMGRFGEYPAEALSRALEDAAEAEAREPRARGEAQMTEEQAIAFDLLIENLEAVRDDLEGMGVVAPRKVDRGGWEMAPVSQKQVDAIKDAKRHTRHCDPAYRPALKTLAAVPYAMSRGQAGMLLDVLYGSARWSRLEADRRELDGNERFNVHWKRAAGLTPPVQPMKLGKVSRVADVG